MTTQYLQLVGSDDPLAAGAALLWSEEVRVGFNCPEGLQRFASEVKLRLPRIATFFFTRVTPGSSMGFPGFLFTVNDTNVRRMRVVGPGRPLAALWGCVKETFFHYREMHMDVVDANATANANATTKNNSGSSSGPTTGTPDATTEAAVEAGTRVDPMSPTTCGSMQVFAISHAADDTVASFLCTPAWAAKFDAAKAKALGVKPGPKYAELKRGNAVASDGIANRTVTPAEVMAPPSGPVGGILLLDVDRPAEAFPDIALVRRAFAGDAATPHVRLHTIVHMAPFATVTSPEYAVGLATSLGGGDSSGGVRHIVASADYRARLTAFPTALANRNHMSLLSPRFISLPNADLAAGPKAVSSDRSNNNNNSNNGGGDAAVASMVGGSYRSDSDHQGLAFAGATSTAASGAPDWRFSRRVHLGTGAVSAEDPVTFPTAAVAAGLLGDDFVRAHIVKDDDPVSCEAGGINNNNNNNSDADKAAGIGMEFYGTGSAVPSKYRNVSCAVVTVLRNAESSGGAATKRLVLDCGEGSAGQIWNAVVGSRLYGDGAAQQRGGGGGSDVLLEYAASIDLFLVSHLHADHHLGIFALLELRALAIERGVTGPAMIPIIGPTHWVVFFERMMSTVFTSLWRRIGPHVALYKCDGGAKATADVTGVPLWLRAFHFDVNATSGNDEPSAGGFDALRRGLGRLGVTSLAMFPVDHPAFAYGAEVVFNGGGASDEAFRLVFSGDTQPCETLTAACAGADLVIHEATFADGLEAEARAKRHSTVGEAVTAAATARALLLNHFSQRYPKLPSFVAERGAAAIAAAAEKKTAAATGDTASNGGASSEDDDRAIGRPRVGIAFDLMRVASVRRDMASLEAATPSYQALLEEYERWGDGTSKRLRTGAGTDPKKPVQPQA